MFRAMTSEEKQREVRRIGLVEDWPCYPILHVKKVGDSGYVAFGTIGANGHYVAAVVHDKFTDQVERFASIEAMVEAGWIGD